MLKLALTSGILIIAGLLFAAPPVHADDGHCRYRQFSPKLRLWYKACEMPATPESCKELISNYKRQLEYGDGACPLKGAAGPCVVGASQMFFYAGRAEELAKGCEMMNGIWRPATRAAEQ